MRKLISKIFPICVIVIVLLMILVGLRSCDGGGTAPSYQFLSGRNPIKFEKVKTENEDRRYTYSFEADFNDLCSKAHAELTPDGFAVREAVQILSGKEFRERYYYLKEKFPRGAIYIYIYENRQCIKLPDSNDYAMAEKAGWIVVTVVYGEGWRWPF